MMLRLIDRNEKSAILYGWDPYIDALSEERRCDPKCHQKHKVSGDYHVRVTFDTAGDEINTTKIEVQFDRAKSTWSIAWDDYSRKGKQQHCKSIVRYYLQDGDVPLVIQPLLKKLRSLKESEALIRLSRNPNLIPNEDDVDNEDRIPVEEDGITERDLADFDVDEGWSDPEKIASTTNIDVG